MTSFQNFGLAEPITRALVEENYVTPTPIQVATIPVALSGRDVVGIAQTGTGKTAAFALPILHRLSVAARPPQRKTCHVLVLSPTRELAGQILDSFRTYGRHLRISSALAIGGVPMGRQVRALLNGVDVLVATPGRLLDLVRGNALRLSDVGVLVLDEADRMLDMGFIHDIRTIVAKLPAQRQTLFFSATMPQAIAQLADQMLHAPAKVAVSPVASTVERVEQRIIHLDRAEKPTMLADLLTRETVERALVFTRTKHGADKVVRGLAKAGIAAEAIHGNKSQSQRERALAALSRWQRANAGRDRYRGARHRRRGHHTCGELRSAECAGNLCASDRPHRARRRGRRRHLLLRRRGGGVSARYREAHSHHDSGDRARRPARASPTGHRQRKGAASGGRNEPAASRPRQPGTPSRVPENRRRGLWNCFGRILATQHLISAARTRR